MSKYNLAFALPQHSNKANIMSGGATRSILSIQELMRKSGEFKVNQLEKADLLISYNNTEEDFNIREKARANNIKVVYSFRNIQQSPYPDEINKINSYFVATNFISQFYTGRFNISSKVLDLPFIEEDVIATNKNGKYLTIVNCSKEKGLYLIEAILEELWKFRKDIPVHIIESRGRVTPKILKYPLLDVSREVDKPWKIYQFAKTVIMPSLWLEPAGRVIAEALLNGIPIAYSSRGGMKEVANGGGAVINIQEHITPNTRDERELRLAARSWVMWINKIWDNKDIYSRVCELNKIAGEKYLERNITPLYVSYFKQVIEQGI